jgi:hypothetical protein
MVVSLFDMSNTLNVPSTSTEGSNTKPPKKKRRLLPYQGDDDDITSLRSERLRRWTVGMGKKERERVQALAMGALPPRPWPTASVDEINRERGVVLQNERGGE